MMPGCKLPITVPPKGDLSPVLVAIRVAIRIADDLRMGCSNAAHQEAMTLSFCQTGRSSRTAMAILASNITVSDYPTGV